MSEDEGGLQSQRSGVQIKVGYKMKEILLWHGSSMGNVMLDADNES